MGLIVDQSCTCFALVWIEVAQTTFVRPFVVLTIFNITELP